MVSALAYPGDDGTVHAPRLQRVVLQRSMYHEFVAADGKEALLLGAFPHRVPSDVYLRHEPILRRVETSGVGGDGAVGGSARARNNGHHPAISTEHGVTARIRAVNVDLL